MRLGPIVIDREDSSSDSIWDPGIAGSGHSVKVPCAYFSIVLPWPDMIDIAV
jgi:hypothetical protein